MSFIKRNSNKFTGVALSLALLCTLSFGTIQLFSGCDAIFCSQPNSVRVCKIDDNHAKLHCDSVKTSNSDFLFAKSEPLSGSFQYSISDLNGGNNLYEFSSPVDISIDEGTSTNHQLNVAIAGAASGASGLAITGAAAAAASAAPAAVGLVNGVAMATTAGAAGIAATGTFSAGFWLGASLAAAALGPVAIVAGAGALVGAG